MHNESGFIRRYQRGRTTSQALSAAQAFRVSATLLILEMTAALGSWIRKAPFAAGLRPRASARFALCIRTFPRRGSDGFTGEPLAPRSWHSLDARQFRVTWFVTSFSCLRAWWHMQTHLPRRPRSGPLRLMSSGKRDQKRARKAATVIITTPQESADKPVITTADWPIERRSSNLVGP